MTFHRSADDEPLQSLIAEILEAENRGEAVDREALIGEHPELADSLRDFFSNHDHMKLAAGIDALTLPSSTGGISSDDPALRRTGRLVMNRHFRRTRHMPRRNLLPSATKSVTSAIMS